MAVIFRSTQFFTNMKGVWIMPISVSNFVSN